MGRRDRDDDEAGFGLADIGRHGHARTVAFDAPHRCAQHHPRVQFGGRGFGDLLRAAGKAVLLGAVLDVEQSVQAAGRVRVAGGVQHRHVVGLAPPGHPRHDRQQVARRGGCPHRAQPAAERQAVEFARPAGVPRGRQRDAAGDPVELPAQSADVQQAGQGQLGNGAAIRVRPAAPVDQILAVVVRGRGGNVEFGRHRQQGVLGRPDESAAQVGRQSGDVAGQRPPTDPVAALEDHHVVALPVELARGGEPGKARSDHDDVDDPGRL